MFDSVNPEYQFFIRSQHGAAGRDDRALRSISVQAFRLLLPPAADAAPHCRGYLLQYPASLRVQLGYLKHRPYLILPPPRVA